MDTSKDRVFLHKGMAIMMVKELVQLIIESVLILAYLSADAMGLGYAVYLIVVNVIAHVITFLLYFYWKMSFKSYYEQLADYEYNIE